jgi:hypothetical protein
MMKADLSDAIALVRGDRFYTSSLSPSTLTTWGYRDTKREPNNGGLGGAFSRLTRHLPRHYKFGSLALVSVFILVSSQPGTILTEIL